MSNYFSVAEKQNKILDSDTFIARDGSLCNIVIMHVKSNLDWNVLLSAELISHCSYVCLYGTVDIYVRTYVLIDR